MGLLTESSRGGLFTRRGSAFAAVAALHVVALALLIHSRIHVDDEPEPVAMRVALFADAPTAERPTLEPPPLPPPPAVPVLVPPMIELPPMERAITQPPAAPPAGSPPAVAAVRSDAPVMLDASDVDYLRMPAPRYPRAAKQARLQGTVLVWVLIDSEGHPRDVRVHRSSGYEQLDREGCDAVRRAMFRPYRRDGVGRSAQVIVPIEFTLTIRTASHS